jgi:tRNA(Leu) C34 or U34 (ribose-2'-O)-methylase TrmL
MQHQCHHCLNPTPYLILTNVQKKQNIKNILLSCAAFGVAVVFVVGQKKFDFDASSPSTAIPPTLLDFISNGGMQIVRIDSLEECAERIKSMYCCDEMRLEMEVSTHQLLEPSDYHGSQSNKSIGRIPIIGIEIDPASISLEQQTFRTSTAFMMGNEGQGMTSKQMAICDGFVRIEQYGGGTASLNVSVSVAVVLQRFFEKKSLANCQKRGG